MRQALVVSLIVGVVVGYAVSFIGRSQQLIASERPAQPTVLPTVAPTAVATPVPLPPREDVVAATLTVNSARRATDLSPFTRANPGRVFIVVDVTLASTGSERLPYSPLEFTVKDADGYEHQTVLAEVQNGLLNGTLGPGQRVRGVLAFDVPAGATGLTVSYRPIGTGRTRLPVTATLGDVR